MGELIKYGELKRRLLRRGIRGARLRIALKNFPRILPSANSRAYYDWNEAKRKFNIKG